MLEYYKILWLKQGVSMEEVIWAYTRLAMKNNPNNGWTLYLFNIIHYAYNEIINNYSNEWLKKDYLLLEEYEIKHNDKDNIDAEIIDAEIIENNIEVKNESWKDFLPEPYDICNEIYNIFKYYGTNPFIKDDKYDLNIIILRFNYLQLKKEKEKRIIDIEKNDLFMRKSIFNKVDILSEVWPAIDLALYLCDLYNYDINNSEARSKIRILLIKIAAKDIIAKNWWMILNDNK